MSSSLNADVSPDSCGARNLDFRALFEHSPTACLVLLADAPRYTIVAVSEAYLRVTLTRRDALLDRPLFAAFPSPPDNPTACDRVIASLERVIATGLPDALPVQRYAIRRPDGEWDDRHWSTLNTPLLEADGRVCHIIHKVEDVTEIVRQILPHDADDSSGPDHRVHERRRVNQRLIEALIDRLRAEEQLRQQADRLREHTSILEFADLLIREPDDRISHWSYGAERLYGYSPEEALGRISHELLRAEFPKPLAEIKAQLMEHGEWHGELTHHTRTGEPIIVTSHWVLYRDEHGTQDAILEVNHDITTMKRIEAERERLLLLEQQAHAEAEAANRAKDDFIALVAHELRNPLNAILNWAKLLNDGRQDSATLTRASEVILRNAKLQQNLIDDLMDSARIASGKLQLDLEPLDPVPIIAAAVDAMRPAAKTKGVRLDAHLDPTAGPLNGDANRLQQVVWNLLSNALKFTPKSGSITVGLQRTADALELQVSDTGQGIAPENLPWVFERFHQADERSGQPRQGGLGLGLSLVKQLVELHGGTVTASSPGLGQGATFTIRLPCPIPRVPSPLPSASTGLEFTPETPLTGRRILIVDDDADARDLLRLILLAAGAEVMAVDSAAEALAILRDPSPGVRPGLLISDIVMPRQDGCALIREWRGIEAQRGLPPLPAIALSASLKYGDRQQALASGFHSYLPKPVEPAKLVNAIRALPPPHHGAGP